MIESIHSLDLQYIVKRIVKQLKWAPRDARKAVRKYKNFLILRFLYPDYQIVPTDVIDVVWHEHILHTEKYLQDCKKIFGDYFHHHPTEHAKKKEKEIADSNFLKTARLYEKHFQEPYGKIFDINIWL